MHDLGIKHVMATFVPPLLLPEQKEHCAAVANDLIQTATNEPDLLKKVITRDEHGSTATSVIWKGSPVVPMEITFFPCSKKLTASSRPF